MQRIIVPISILMAGAFIAVAVYMSNTSLAGRGSSVADIARDAAAPETVIAPVSEVDHIQGDPSKAKITIVEYSDIECPFCKRHHQNLSRIFKEYNADGKDTIAWVYRHFPLDIHANAPKEAEATECASELGGSKGFWDYIGLLYEKTPSNDGLDLALLPEFADQIGLDKEKFTECLKSGRYESKITEARNAGFKAGARSTPYTILAVRVGSKTQNVELIDEKGTSLGALPYESLKAVIDSFLR
jgi:protein-disulfide isomerase